MALINNPKMFSEGAVTFNTQPAVNFYANLLAHKRAKEDALDEYYRKLPSTINDAGVRDQERPIINQQVNDAMDYWMRNKEAVRNPRLDNGKAQYQLEKMYRDARETVDQSKQLGKKQLELGKMRMTDSNPHIWDDPDIVDKLHKLDLPINDPNHQDFDMATAVIPPKPFGVKEQGELFKTAVGEFKPKKIYDETKSRSDNKSGQIFVPYQEFYQPEQIKTIGDNAAKLTGENKSANRFYSSLMHDPNWYAKATDAFQSVYGKNNIIDSPEKAAAAAAVMQAKTPIGSGEDMRANSQLAFNRQLYLANYRHSLSQGDKEKADLWIDKYVQGITDKAKQSGQTTTYNYANGTSIQGYKIQSDPTLNKALGFDSKNPGAIIATPDGEYIVAPYKTDANFQPIVKDGVYQMDTEKAAKITEDQLKLALGKQAGVSQLNKEMNVNAPVKNKQVAATIPTGTMQEWLSTPGWDKDKINKAVKAGKIKVK